MPYRLITKSKMNLEVHTHIYNEYKIGMLVANV